LLTANISPSFADDTAQAIELIALSFKCAVPAYEPKGEYNDYVKLMEQYEYIGDQNQFRVRMNQVAVTTSIRGTEKSESIIEFKAKYSELESVIIDGLDVTLRCKGGKECIVSSRVPEDQFNRNNDWFEDMSFRVCDADTASNVKAALEFLITFNRERN
jgi:hypothetical protein